MSCEAEEEGGKDWLEPDKCFIISSKNIIALQPSNCSAWQIQREIKESCAGLDNLQQNARSGAEMIRLVTADRWLITKT